jgi:hypothetical protein
MFNGIHGSYSSNVFMNNALMKYRFEAGWHVVRNQDLLNMGIVLFMNDSTHTYDIISLTAADPKNVAHLKRG